MSAVLYLENIESSDPILNDAIMCKKTQPKTMFFQDLISVSIKEIYMKTILVNWSFHLLQ